VVVTTKKSRRPVLGREAAAEVKASPSLGGGADAGQSIRPSGGPGDIQPSTPPGKAPAPANDDGPRRSAIVTAQARSNSSPDMTPEEHRRRGDAADTLFREMKRRIAAVVRSGGALPPKKP